VNNQPTKLHLHTVIHHNAISAQQASVATPHLRAIATRARYFGKYAQVMLLQSNKNYTTLHTHTHNVVYDEFDLAVMHGTEINEAHYTPRQERYNIAQHNKTHIYIYIYIYVCVCIGMNEQ
jgi:hypothetical protein